MVEREELANAALSKKHSTEIAELNAAAKQASVDYRTEQSRLILAHSTEQALKEKRADALKAEIVKLEAVVAELEARHNRRISVRVKKRFKRVWGRVLGRRSRGGEEE